MSLSAAQFHPIMCITQDNLAFSHLEQAKRLCGAGAKWIQLRMKNAAAETWLNTAVAVVDVCHAYGAVCIVNDHLEIAVGSGADGVHLGRKDGDWREARRELGPRLILGGTVNNSEDARKAVNADCLDYVGIGPWRFTATKGNLSPILGPEGVSTLVRQLDGLPAWAIGGIEGADLPRVRATGAVGAALSSALFRGGNIEDNYHDLLAAWEPKQLR